MATNTPYDRAPSELRLYRITQAIVATVLALVTFGLLISRPNQEQPRSTSDPRPQSQPSTSRGVDSADVRHWQDKLDAIRRNLVDSPNAIPPVLDARIAEVNDQIEHHQESLAANPAFAAMLDREIAVLADLVANLAKPTTQTTTTAGSVEVDIREQARAQLAREAEETREALEQARHAVEQKRSPEIR